MHQEKENYYLQKYLPLLNTIFISNMSETQTYDSLWAEHPSILRTHALRSSTSSTHCVVVLRTGRQQQKY